MFYIFDQLTKAFLHSTLGQPNPMKLGEFLTPPHSTTVSIPVIKQFETAVFNGVGWDVYENNVGRLFWNTEDAEPVTFEIGDVVTELMTDNDPVEFKNPKWVGSEWVEDIAASKEDQKNKIRGSFHAASIEQVGVGGVTWNGGINAAMVKDAAMRLAERMGATTVTLYDSSNKPHALSFEDALAVVIEIGSTYQTQLARKQTVMVSIDAATTMEDIDSINF